MKDILDKLRSPIFSNFIFSWLAWNWKIPYLTLFVSEENIYHDKLTQVQFIIDSYGGWYCKFCFLFLAPACSTAVIIIVHPFLYNLAEKIRLSFNYKLEKYSEIHGKEYEPMKKLYDDLVVKNSEITELTKRELATNILYNSIPLNKIFVGQWGVEIYQNQSHQKFTCTCIGDKLIDRINGTIITFASKIVTPDQNTDTYNFRGTVTIFTDEKNQTVEELSFTIVNRMNIELYKHSIQKKIILKWISVD